jgi:hypothetical protein
MTTTRIFLMLTLILAIAGCGSNTGSTTAATSATATPTSWQMPTIQPSYAATPGQAVPSGPAVDDKVSGPLTTFSDGTYEIGTGEGQVPPGKYRSTGPDAGDSDTCYAATLKNNDGAIGDIVDQKVSRGQTLLTVPKSGAHYVDIRGCTFRKM